MEDPFAARRTPDARRDSVAGEAGYTETSAPESIKKGRRRLRQNKERDPEEEERALTEGRMPGGEGDVTASRHGRLPEPAAT